MSGIGRGLAKGAGLTIFRMGIGLYEAVTFPVPYPKDFASPYADRDLPDYSWE